VAVETVLQETPPSVQERDAQRGQRYSIRLYGKWCKGCGLCIAFCPQEVFAEDTEHYPRVVHPERCVACQWCVTHCPDFAIVVERVNDSKGQVGK
jgi:NAD-dependent dihydropyrimidine dehydrogenase PreA subunit